MAISIKHKFTSAKSDGTDSTLVQPSNWNDTHDLTLAAGKVLGRDSSGAGAAQELPISVDSSGQSMIPPSGTTAQRPGTPAAGMLRYNTTLSKIELYNGSAWGSVGGGGATVSDTAPSSPNAGDLWWKSDDGQMYVYYNDGSSSQWVIANAFTGNVVFGDVSVSSLNGGPLAGNRNRIINGDMRIDQRNAGAAVTASGSFVVDRWKVTNTSDGAFSSQQSTTVPTGFKNSLYVTTTTADASLTTTQQLVVTYNIEGYDVADFGFGTASAKTITLSFWVRSSLTGTFGGAFKNSAADRSYPFTYSISSANTWEQKSVTIAGDTSGTWLTDNGTGLTVAFGLGAGPDRSGTAGAWASANYNSATSAVSVIGTLNATFYITGVQLEVGSVATPFERRQYGTELMLCQRYYYRTTASNAGTKFGSLFNTSTTTSNAFIQFPVPMRVAPSALEQSGTAGDYSVYSGAGTVTACSAVPQFTNSGVLNSDVLFTVASGLTSGQGGQARAVNTSAYLGWSAEL